MDRGQIDIHIENIVGTLRNQTNLALLSKDDLLQLIEKEVKSISHNLNLTISEQVEILDATFARIRGYDILDKLIHDSSVTEIMVNAYDRIFYEKGGKVYASNFAFASPEIYRNVIQKIVDEAGKEVHLRNPILDCRMKDGARVNIVLSPIAAEGDVMTIRRFGEQTFTLNDLVDNKTLSQVAADFLKDSVRKKKSMFISGGTGSGKTTLLNVLAGEIPKDERLITIEDARELNFDGHPNWIALEARRKNVQGEGEISIRDLIRTALRMRPDRIIVGEVRGAEALDMLQAFNTGHEGSLSTGHANSIIEMQSRLETMVLSADAKLPFHAIRQQIGRAFDLCIHIQRQLDGSRKVGEIAQMVFKEDQLTYKSLFRLEGDKLAQVADLQERRIEQRDSSTPGMEDLEVKSHD